MATRTRKAPWQRKRPPGPRKPLSTTARRKARATAKRAGRRYPNLVDNMNAAKASKRRGRKKSTK